MTDRRMALNTAVAGPSSEMSLLYQSVQDSFQTPFFNTNCTPSRSDWRFSCINWLTSSATVEQDAPSPVQLSYTQDTNSYSFSHDVEEDSMIWKSHIWVRNKLHDAWEYVVFIPISNDSQKLSGILHHFSYKEGKNILLISQTVPRATHKPILNMPESQKKYGYESCDPVDTPIVEKSKRRKIKMGKLSDPSHYRVLWMRSQLTDYGLGFNKIPILFTKALPEKELISYPTTGNRVLRRDSGKLADEVDE
ncbi:hypothetical protein Tco_1473905 [Tanacetum coccineum]